MNILAILQARTSSTRLPGKVLKPILGRPMIERQIERLRRAKNFDRLIVATSDDANDSALAELCAELSVDCFRGSLNDVLDRFYQAALPHQPQHVVRLTGDCPLADPGLIDAVIAMHIANGNDYTANCLQATFPDGLDVEVVRFSALAEAWREARLPSQREHVLPFIHSAPERYQIGHYRNDVDLSNLRWTVDEPGDYDLVSHIYEALYPANPAFTTADILMLLEKEPVLRTLNTHYVRNEGFLKSLQADEVFLSQGQ
ncbi:MAG: glycosyltransferase family protein [Pseudomonadota bacterium]